MGSANCKEYTTSNDNPTSCGTPGSYQSKKEVKMAERYGDPVTICTEQDIQENEMKEFTLYGDKKVLLVRQKGRLNAIGNKCTHYGAPLVTGTLGIGHVRCPWHGACFNFETGDIEDFPGLDSVPCYKVEVNNGKVQVRARVKDLNSDKRVKDMFKRNLKDERTFVVVGGGPAGAVCVETLRQEGYTGRLFLVCREDALPYDRIKISKSMNIELETIQLRKQEFYKEHDIETLLGVEATSLDGPRKSVHLSNGVVVKFDKIFIATGLNARKLPIDGADLENVVTIRSIADANNINNFLMPQLEVVCLGSSFIAMEAAAFLAKKVEKVTIIGRDKYPLVAAFGEKIGERVMRLYEENGVTYIGESGITEIRDLETGKVKQVVLNDGTELPCDLLIMGVGGEAATGFMKDSGITLNDNGTVDVDMHMETDVPDVYAGGDIANAPVHCIGDEKATIGHYQLAQYHGRIAALNMAGRPTNLKAVPFFFTMLFNKGFRYAGYGAATDVFIDGNLEEWKFAAYNLDESKNVISVTSVGRDPVVSQFAELLLQGQTLTLSELRDNPNAWIERLKPTDCGM